MLSDKYLYGMREQLVQLEGERKKFTARFSRLGKKINYKGYSEDTILLTSVQDAETGTTVSDHVWFTFSKGFEKLTLRENVLLEFEARVKEYKKGYVNRQLGVNQRKRDLKLSHPTKIRIVE